MVPRPRAHKSTARPKAAAAGVALLAGTLAWAAPSGAGVAQVRGEAYGQRVSVSAPGAPPVTSGPAPAVATTPGAGSLTEAAPSATVEGGPAGAFGGAYLRTGPLTAATTGATRPARSVTTSATAGSVDALGGLLTADGVAAACTAEESESTGTATVTGGRLAVSATETVELPSEPPAATTLTATTGAGEHVTVVLNEQEVVDGILVVNAVRVVLEGPSVTGSIVVASASCGVAASPAARAAIPASGRAAPAGAPGTTVPTTAPPTVPAPATAGPEEAATPGPEDAAAPGPQEAATPGPDAAATPGPEEAAATAGPDEAAIPTTEDAATPGPAEAVSASTPAVELPPDLVDTLFGVRAAVSALRGVTVSAVNGSAFGFHVRVSILNSPFQERGPAPTVTLPASGSTDPLTGTVPSALARIGPADLFMAGEITVRTQGTTGAEGSATSSTSVGRSGDPDRPGPVLFDRIASSCRATAAGVSGTTTITGGRLETKYDEDSAEPTVVEDIPVDPAPNTTRTGTLDHIEDSYRAVFNEQVHNGDGSLTVNAVHLYLLGPSGVGDIIVGQSRCGVTKAVVETTASTTATTTAAPAATAAVVAATASPSPSGAAVAGASQSRGGRDGSALAVTGGSAPRLVPLALLGAALAAARLRRLDDEGPSTGR